MKLRYFIFVYILIILLYLADIFAKYKFQPSTSYYFIIIMNSFQMITRI
jgi:hypothetical protein